MSEADKLRSWARMKRALATASASDAAREQHLQHARLAEQQADAREQG